MKKNREIILKILIPFLVFFAFLPVLILLVLQIPPLQKELSYRLSNKLTKSLNTRTIVNRISYSLDNKLVIKKIYIEDYNLDTLFYINKIKVHVWEIFKDELNFSHILIDGFKIRIVEDTNGYTNLLVFLDNLPNNPANKQKDQKSININVRDIEIKNFDISYTSSLDTVIHEKFNPKNFHISHLNFSIKNFKIQDSVYSFVLYDFMFKEKESGFNIKNISTNFLFTNKQLRFKDLSIDFGQFSHIFIPILQVHYDSIPQLAKPEELEFLVIVDSSTSIFSQDLKYFVPQTKNNVFRIKFNLTAFGSLGNINILPIGIEFGKGSKFVANAHIIGLPDINHTYLNITLDTINFLLKDLSSIRDDCGNPIIQLPSQVYKISKLSATGKITGLINNFSVFLDLKTNIGKIFTQFDVNTIKNNHIKGYVKVDNLSLDKILDKKDFGSISMNSEFEIFNKDKQFWGNSQAKISSFTYNNYTYTNISSKISFDNKNISAALVINDPNLKLNINTETNNLDKKGYNTKFLIALDKVNFYPLNFDKEDPNSSLKFSIKGELTGHNINDFYGKITLTQPLIYIKNLEKIEIKNFVFNSVLKQYINGLPFKEMFIRSDVLDGSIIGVFELNSISLYLQNIISHYFPSLNKKRQQTNLFVINTQQKLGSNLILQINLKDLTPITRIFLPKISLAPHTIIQGVYKNIDNTFMLKLISDSLLFSNNLIIKPKLTINTINNYLSFNFSTEKVKLGVLNFKNLLIWGKGKNDTLKFGYTWNNETQLKNFGLINGYIAFNKNDLDDTLKTKFTITYDSLYINDIKWQIKRLTTIIKKNVIEINSFFQNPDKKQSIGIVGKISPNPNDKLFLRIQFFDISQLNPILENVKLEGFLNGNTFISNILSNPIITSDNIVSKLKVNDVDLQMLTAYSRYNAEKNLVIFKIYTEKTLGEIQDTTHERYIDIDGMYNITKQSYNVDINFRKFKLKAFYPYFQNFISAISRFTTIHGKIAINGSGKNVNLIGNLGVSNAAFRLRSTNVTYTVNKIMNVHFTKDTIIIDTTTIISQGATGKAKLWGMIYRNEFNDFLYNINFKPDTFMILNINNDGSQPFYGKAYVTGSSKVLGIGSNLSFLADLKTDDNTDLTFLLNSPKKISGSVDFINFISNDTLQEIKQSKNFKKSNLDININLEITPKSKFAIILDEQTGEKFSVQGNGLLNIKLSPYGDFLMSGNLSIDKGEYYFTLENIVNKKLQIKPGSTIKWNGSPQDADLDITAIYKVNNANLYDLTLDDNYWNVRTPVNCFINIKGKLTEPQISFDIDLPKADQRISSQLDNLELAEKTKQVLSLLIIGKFQPLPGLTFNPNQIAKNTSAMDILSGQLSNLLSSIDPNLELGLNYQAAQQGNLTPEQLELALSYKLWDERIIINTDVGIGSNSQPTITNNTKQFIGDVDIEVKLNKKGNLRLKAFNQTNRNEFFDKGPYTQGVGIFFKKDFTSLLPKKKKKKNDKNKNNSNYK